MSAFATYVVGLIKEGHTQRLPFVFDMTEELLSYGDTTVQEAVTTCFLEYLLHAVSAEVPAERFISLLGPKSRAYSLAWDEFTGVQTVGL